jgi:hypothetical protein
VEDVDSLNRKYCKLCKYGFLKKSFGQDQKFYYNGECIEVYFNKNNKTLSNFVCSAMKSLTCQESDQGFYYQEELCFSLSSQTQSQEISPTMTQKAACLNGNYTFNNECSLDDDYDTSLTICKLGKKYIFENSVCFICKRNFDDKEKCSKGVIGECPRGFYSRINHTDNNIDSCLDCSSLWKDSEECNSTLILSCKYGFFLYDSGGSSLFDFCVACNETHGCANNKTLSFEVFRIDGKGKKYFL